MVAKLFLIVLVPIICGIPIAWDFLSRALFACLIVRLIPENQVRLPCSSTCFVLTKPDGEDILNLLNVDEI